MREIWIEGTSEKEIAVIEDGKLCEYFRDDVDRTSETVILGRVDRIVPGMQAAFVNIGQEKCGFLPLKESSESCVVTPLQSGMSILVQIRKEAQGTKGAFLTRDITLCGQYMIYMPCNRYIGISAKIEDKKTRTALKKLGADLTGGEAGIVLRTSAASADANMIAAEYEELAARWKEIVKKAATAHVPSIQHQPRSVVEMLLDDYAARGIDCIRTEDSMLAQRLSAQFTVSIEMPGFLSGSKWPDEREKALDRYVWLKSGSNLVIDRCEAMTVIDVNTAKFTGKRDLNDTALKTNLEACAEIVRQIRLRNLAGIIIVDMIDMQNDADRKQVLDALTEAFTADRIKTVIHGFTSLGLVEMTRKKALRSLSEVWSISCMTCHGTGRNLVRREREADHDRS